MVMHRVFGEMYNLKAISTVIVRLPLAPASKQRAAPPFQLPYTLGFPVQEFDFWQLHSDLLAAALRQAEALMPLASGDPGRAFLSSIDASDRTAISEIAQVLSKS